MKTSRLFSLPLVLALAAGCATASHAANSPFDGTWHMNAAQAKLSTQPIKFYIAQDWYHCDSCTPVITIKADGADQPVQQQAYDTLSVKQSSATELQLIAKKGDKVVYEQTRSVSKDGKTLTVKIKSYSKDGGNPSEEEITAKRVGALPTGVHATSGEWQTTTLKSDEAGSTMTLKLDGNQLSYQEPNGVSFTATTDGKDAPAKGSFGYDTVSVKQDGANKLEITEKRNGEDIGISTYTVDAGGKTMTEQSVAKRSGRTSSYKWQKK